MFEGGPRPIYPAQWQENEEDILITGKVRTGEKVEEEWRNFAACGGAGNRADTPEEQRARYKTGAEDTIELHPGLPKYNLRKPDLIVTASVDYLIHTFDVNDNFKLLQTFYGHVNCVNGVEPYRGNKLVSCADDMTVRVWKRGTEEYGELLMTIWVAAMPIKSVCPLPGQRAAAGCLDRVIRILSLSTGALLHRIDEMSRVGPDDNYMQGEGLGAVWCFLHLRGNVLATGSDDASVRVWNIDTARCYGMYLGHKGWGKDIGKQWEGLKFSENFGPVWKLCHLGKDGERFASCSYDRTVCIWDASDLRNLSIVRKWQAGMNAVLSICQAGEHLLATVCADREVKIWDCVTGEQIRHTFTRGVATGVAYIDDSSIAIAGGDATVRHWDWQQDKDLMGKHGFYAHDLSVEHLAKIYLDTEAEQNWTQQPIMYQTARRIQGYNDAQEALAMIRSVVRIAMEEEEDRGL